MTEPKNVYKSPLAPIYTNFEGGGGKSAKNAYFFKILPAAMKIWPKTVFLVLWESSENQFGRPKKSNFLKILDPLLLYIN